MADVGAEDGDLDIAPAEEVVLAAAAEGIVLEEGAALGAPGVGNAQEEEALEQAEFVEVEVDSDMLSIYEPLPPYDHEDLSAEPSSSVAAPAVHAPAPVGRGSLSSRTPLVLGPGQPAPVIDRKAPGLEKGSLTTTRTRASPCSSAYPKFPDEAADPHELPDSA